MPYGVDAVLFFESAMLIAFSVSWYCSIWKMLTTRQACGKSLSFVLLICFGYICGIASKALVAEETGLLPPVVLLYAWNLVVTTTDAMLVVHYGREPDTSSSPVIVRFAERLVARASRTAGEAGVS